MRLAVTFDFENITDLHREGLGVYAKHLISALMNYDKELELEFWTYSFNKRSLKLLFADILKKYNNRIKIFTIDSFAKPLLFVNNKNLYFPLIICYYVKKILYSIGRCFNYNEFQKKLEKLDYIKISTSFDYKSPDIIKKIQKKSKADIVYIIFVTLKLGKFFACPKVMQVHDLFTLRYRDMFAKHWNNRTLDESNKITIDSLSEYAIKNTTFVSSSEFTVKEQTLKCIPNVKPEQTNVISFPPLIKDFNSTNVLSKEEFKAKYGLWDKYIAVPSQNRPNKNWTVIFKALARLKQKGINIQFVTTGKVNHIESDDILVKKLGLKENVLEIGSIPEQDLYMLYKYEDIAIGSTFIEGMGTAGQVTEALKVGNIPAIHSISFGINEGLAAIGLTMKTADLNWFDPNDDEKLANLIEEVLSNPEPHIKKQKHIIDAYNMSITWDNVAENYIKLFRNKIYKEKQ